MSDLYPRYFTVADICDLFAGRVTPALVSNWKRAGLITPTVTIESRLQYGRAALARIVVLQLFQRTFGEKSPLPAQIIREHAGTIDRVLDDLDRDAGLEIALSVDLEDGTVVRWPPAQLEITRVVRDLLDIRARVA